MIPTLLANLPALDPVPQPAPSWLFWFLLILTFLLHVLPMNFVLGGSIIAAVTAGQARKGDRPHHTALVRWMSKAMPVFIAAAISFGVAPLLFVQVLWGRLFFSGSILMGWWWFAVIPILLCAYYAAYFLAFKTDKLAGGAGVVRWVAAALFLAIAFIYTNNMSLMLRAGLFGDMYGSSGRGFQLNLGDPTYWPRLLHFLLAAIAVAGMIVALYGLVRRKSDPVFGVWAMRRGGLWFAAATAVNIVPGLWFLLALPRETLLRFMGGSMSATAFLGLGVLLGLGAMVMMFMTVYSPDPSGLVRGSAMSLLLTLVFMTLSRDQVRRGALHALDYRTSPWVATQWFNIALFAVLLVGAVLTVAWMVLAFARAGAAKESSTAR